MTEPGLGSGALREALEHTAKLFHRHCAYVSYASPHAGVTFEDCMEVECVENRRVLALSLSSPIEPGLREITIQEFAAELYQICGALNAPAPVLDQLSAAASGRPLPYTTLLPFPDPQASSEIREALEQIRSLCSGEGTPLTRDIFKIAYRALVR